MSETTAAVLLIGDELLSGKVADENARFLIGELRELGVALRRILVIPDEVDEIADAARTLAARFDHVFTSGGVGPTHDDCTMAGLARAFDRPIVRDATIERLLRAYYGPRLVERSLRMADLVAGAELVVTDARSWPVVFVQNVCVLPGVPELFRRKFQSVRERFRQPPYHLRAVYSNEEEGALAVHLDRIDAEHPAVDVGSYPRFDTDEYKVKVTLESKDPEAVARATDALLALLPRASVVKVD